MIVFIILLTESVVNSCHDTLKCAEQEFKYQWLIHANILVKALSKSLNKNGESTATVTLC